MIFDEFYKHYYTYDVLEKTDIIVWYKIRHKLVPALIDSVIQIALLIIK